MFNDGQRITANGSRQAANIFRLSVVFVMLLMFASAAAQAAPDGQRLFARHCEVCHGEAGKGGVGVPLALPSFIDSVSDDYLKSTIRHGRPGRIMPAFEVLSDAQVAAIVRYMRSWTGKAGPKDDRTPVRGDAAHGAKVFKAHCARCHGEDGRGGKGTGVTFSRKRDLPIIAPALNNSGFLAAASDAMIRHTITFGRKGTPMNSMRAAGLSQTDIDDVVAFIRSFEAGAAKQAQALNDKGDEPPVLTAESPYGMEETIDNLKQAITDQNFTLIRVDYLDHGLTGPGKEDKKKVVVHFCNFGFLFEALAIDPRVGMFLPCRVTLIEKDGKVTLSTINPKRLSKLFNNHELDESCDTMYGVYRDLLEDATL